MNEFIQWGGHPLVHRLGWTLLHFLWQGAVVGGVFSVAQIILPKRYSNARYGTACLALLLMLAAPVITFISLGVEHPMPVTLSASEAHSTPAIPPVRAETAGPLISNVQDEQRSSSAAPALHIEKFLPALVFVWLLGVSAFALRLLFGSLHIARLKRRGNEPLGQPWITRLLRLKAALQISRPVGLVKSALVEVPTVLGWLRPIILLPAASLTGLTTGQLECILAHELAHVRRHDYLVNLLQNALEALLFYHPAVWWVSSCVRAEREICCDETAVQLCGNRLVYAEALTTLEELRVGRPLLALGADGGSLLKRIRLISGGSGSGSLPARCWAVGAVLAAMVAIMLISLAVKRVHDDKIPRKAAIWETLDFTGDTLKAVPPQVTIVRSKFSPNKKAFSDAGLGRNIGSYGDPQKPRQEEGFMVRVDLESNRGNPQDPPHAPLRPSQLGPIMVASNFTVTDITGKTTHVSVAPGTHMKVASWISNAELASNVTAMVTCGRDGIVKDIRLIPKSIPKGSADLPDTRWLETDTNFESAQLMGIGVSVEQILLLANGLQGAYYPMQGGMRVLNPAGMPVGRYDFIANLPTGSRAALGDLVKQKFGYAGTRTNILVLYFVLKFDHDGAPGLKPAPPVVGGAPNAASGMSIDEFISLVQGGLGGYITNETGLTGKFDIDLAPFAQFQPGIFSGSLLKRQQRRFLEDLGLQLILTNKISTEYFQIEEVK